VPQPATVLDARPTAAGFRASTASIALHPTAIGTPGAFVLSTLSALAYAAGFPPLSWPITPWLALTPLLVACAALSPARAAIAGMCWAVTAAVGVAGFLPTMLSGYFGLATLPSWLGTVAIVGGLHGVFVSAYAAWVALLVRRRAANPLLLAGGWLACEFARASGGLGSPWALAAYSQVHWTPVIQIADLAGPYGLGLLIAGVNACAAAWLAPGLRGRRPRLATSIVAAALAATLLYGHWRLGQTFADGDAVPVAVVQGGAPTADPAQRAARLERYVTLTTGGAATGDGLIVWPESAVEGYLEEPTTMRDTVLRLTEDGRRDLILGGPHYEPSASGKRYHNSAYLIRGGRIAGRYDKHHLVPFAEDDRLSWLIGKKATTYTAGPGAFVLPASALRTGILLCVEAMFPHLARQAADQGSDVLVNLSNDAWFGDAAPARHQLEIATLRAVENRRYLVRAAATGFSAVVDPSGRMLTTSDFGTTQVLHATVRASHVRTPYQRWGDALAWLVIAAVAGASLRSLLVPPTHMDRRRLT
jgi:apolipoprotein N-acyltransferase